MTSAAESLPANSSVPTNTPTIASPVDGRSADTLSEELAQARRELELLKGADPIRVVELALELQVERLRVSEALKARDATVKRLSDAYTSLRQKTLLIEELQAQLEIRQDSTGAAATAASDAATLTPGLSPKSGSATPEVQHTFTGYTKASPSPETELEVMALQNMIKMLQDENRLLKEANNRLQQETGKAFSALSTRSPAEPPPRYEEGFPRTGDARTPGSGFNFPSQYSNSPFLPRNGIGVMAPPQFGNGAHRGLCSASAPPSRPSSRNSSAPSPMSRDSQNSSPWVQVDQTEAPAELLKTRYAILEAMPLPVTVPQDTVQPISLPVSTSFHEFLTNAPLQLRNSLSNYRVFQSTTTQWCPEREEHGYCYAPVFKCNTNPRVSTAHLWSQAEVVGRINRPTECFFNKDGTWYYAGVYIGFRMEDLTTREWNELPPETTAAIVKETLAGRRNTCPQNVYEISQLYAAGALKVGVVGLQCVGFNQVVYRTILDYSKRLTDCNWTAMSSGQGLGVGEGWSLSASNHLSGLNEVADGLSKLVLRHEGAENAPKATTRH